jgi:hypothetical protein
MATQRLTTRERNYNNNTRDIESTIAVFRKTDNVERLVHSLAQVLTPNEFRMLFATEFANVPLTIRFVDEETN